jgi:hypothetical protein
MGGMAQALEEVRSPQPGVDFRECELGQIVQEATAVAAQGYPSVLVQVNTQPRLTALAVAQALRTVISILVDQACRGSDAGSGVTVKAQRVDAGITVLITDRGPGPSKETSTADDQTPLLGRDLARRLVGLHGGILWAESMPSGENRVSFTIPRKPPELSGVELDQAIEALKLLDPAQAGSVPVPAAAEAWDRDRSEADKSDPVEIELLVELADAPTDGYLTEIDPGIKDEPAAASPELPASPAPRPVEPAHTFIPDPLHPATSILRGLTEDHDDTGLPGR